MEEPTNEAGWSALKAVFILNGAAAVALLAFFATPIGAEKANELALALLLFGLGAATSTLAYAFNFFAHWLGSGGFNIASIVSGLGALIMFLAGLLIGYCSLS